MLIFFFFLMYGGFGSIHTSLEHWFSLGLLEEFASWDFP